MGDQLAFSEQNAQRILAVQGLFGASGRPLAEPGRVLVGEGHLLKRCRRSPQARAFFLFNDILVYGSVVIVGRWYARQQVVALEDVSLEDSEDGLDMKHQWLIRTPRKSFYVSAASAQEKRAWMEHIGECRAERLRRSGRPAGTRFAAVWVPDRAAAICMRCCGRFGLAQRRHHCRRCGFLVCAACSRGRAPIPAIAAKPVRVCPPCLRGLGAAPETTPPPGPAGSARTSRRPRGDSGGRDSSEEEEPPREPSGGAEDDDRGGGDEGDYIEAVPAPWGSPHHVRKDSWSPYVDLNDRLHISDIGDF